MARAGELPWQHVLLVKHRAERFSSIQQLHFFFFFYKTICHISLQLSALKSEAAVKDNLHRLFSEVFQFYEASVIVLPRFHGVNFAKAANKALRVRQQRGGFVPFDSTLAGCLSEMTVHKWLHKCFHSSVITECENQVRLCWSQACPGESWGCKQSSFALKNK